MPKPFHIHIGNNAGRHVAQNIIFGYFRQSDDVPFTAQTQHLKEIQTDRVIAAIKNDDGVDLGPQRSALIALGGRGAVLYRIADDNLQTNPINNRAFIDAESNRSFIASQYFGYLRRDADIGGFLFWLDQVSNAPLRDVPKQHAMVCSFTTSAEYQFRFSLVTTHSNAECQ
jgi:hypothetical protein